MDYLLIAPLNPTSLICCTVDEHQSLNPLWKRQLTDSTKTTCCLQAKSATIQTNLTMAPHVKALSSSCFYHIRSFRQIRPSLDDSTAASVASALISSRLDQLNSICTALRLSTQLVSNVFSMQRLGLLCTGSLTHLHCLQPNFSINSTGFLSNGEYGVSWPL